MCLGLGAVAAQAGHLVAYQVRFGLAAQQLQSTGAHAYFPAVAKSALGVGAGSILLVLALIGAARLVAGRRLEGDQPPSYVRVVAVLFWIQLVCFVLQETIEGAGGASPVALLMWGTLGQLPVALLAAFVLRSLAARIGPAVALLTARPAPVIRIVPTAVIVNRPAAPVVVVLSQAPATSFSRRGPPL